ncbi:MAG TPA: VCBS repeat-containing protein [Planctomycetaceae bacterium]|nr:VCBS repeat-containing protein [Planctomycetaceae bacterium]
MKWTVHFIGKELSLHRMSFADVLGKGRPQLVLSPLLKTDGAGVRFEALEIPANPKTDRWPATILDESLNRMHAHTHVDWDDNGAVHSLVGAAEGTFLVSRKSDGTFTKRPLGTGAEGPTLEARGVGEVKAGFWNHKSGQRFLATVEPMHGNQVAFYHGSTASSEPWSRHVIDTTLKQGHAVWCADLDGNGRDEIIVGHREPGPGPVVGPGLYAYENTGEDPNGWKKHVIDDGGCAVEDAFAADFNGDGRPDLVAGGRATHNVKLYLNRGSK